MLRTIYKIFFGPSFRGFAPNKSATDQIFSLQQPMEKLLEYGHEVHQLFIDFKASYDGIVRVKWYTAMREFGTPTKTRDALSCVLFNLALEKMIRNEDVNARSTILFKSTQLLAYADDTDIMGRTARDVQSTSIQIEQAARDLGLHINEGKTKYMVGTSAPETKEQINRIALVKREQ